MDAAFAFIMICCAASDRRYRTIPNSMIGTLMMLGIFHMITVCIKGYAFMPYLMAIPLFFLCYMCWKRDMFGGGDVKLMTVICLYFGFWQAAIAFEVSLLAMLIQYGMQKCGHKRRGHIRIALAPPLAMGCLITLAGQYIMAIF